MHKGSCLCGAVTFEVAGDLTNPTACHCMMCRKHHGDFVAGTEVDKSSVIIQGKENITWYRSSDKVRRGFCKTCGSSLFFEPVYRDWIGIWMGAFDGPTGVSLERHIFVADKGDYYDIKDGLPQNAQ